MANLIQGPGGRRTLFIVAVFFVGWAIAEQGVSMLLYLINIFISRGEIPLLLVN